MKKPRSLVIALTSLMLLAVPSAFGQVADATFTEEGCFAMITHLELNRAHQEENFICKLRNVGLVTVFVKIEFQITEESSLQTVQLETPVVMLKVKPNTQKVEQSFVPTVVPGRYLVAATLFESPDGLTFTADPRIESFSFAVA